MKYFLAINYNEPNQDDYKGVELSESYGDGEWSFDSGDFVKDWFNAVKHIITLCPDDTYSMLYSSSVDHFIMDGNGYDRATLKFDDEGVAILDYDSEDNGYAELFVKAGTRPTWKELMGLCK